MEMVLQPIYSAQSGLTHNTPTLETTQMSIKRRIEIYIELYSYNGIGHNNKIEQSVVLAK